MFERLRQRCYTKVLEFHVLVQLMHDALLVYRGSGRQAFEHARDAEQLPVSIQAAFGKLRRVPIELSEGFLAECTDRLREVFPKTALKAIPESLQEFRVCVLDGKAIKHVAKRLKPLRGRSGGVLGGRALAAMDFQSGLAVAMRADRDGDANDVKFVPDLLPAVRSRFAGLRLWLADRQFADLVQTATLWKTAIISWCDTTRSCISTRIRRVSRAKAATRRDVASSRTGDGSAGPKISGDARCAASRCCARRGRHRVVDRSVGPREVPGG